MKVRQARRLVMAAIALFLAAALAAPFLRVDQYAGSIRDALAGSLGRPVEIGEVRLTLLTGPGFTVDEVVIAEDPAFGIEPFAWVESVEAHLEWWSLWTGKLQFSSLRLSAPVVNLVKRDGHWNFERLLTADHVSGLPKIAASDGRVNFKFDDTKSVFYLTEADVDLELQDASRQWWRFRVDAHPARTDRVTVGGAGRGLGSFSGRGELRGDVIRADIELDKSPLGDLIALVHGRDLGIHGVVSSRARLKGPPDALEFTGRLEMEELHRWDKMPLWNRTFPISYRGKLDLNRQSLELESQSQAKGAPPLSVRYRVTNYLSLPQWGVHVIWSQLPAEVVTPIARHMGAPLPEDLQVSGMLEGAIGYSGGKGLEGRFVLNEAILALPRRPALTLSRVEFIVDPERTRVLPVDIKVEGDGGSARVEFGYGWKNGDLQVSVSSPGITIDGLPFGTATLPAPLPVTAAVWSGTLRYQRTRDVERGWEGTVDLRDAVAPLEGFAAPVELASAKVRVQGPRFALEQMEGKMGDVAFRGDYRVDAGARPHRFRLEVDELDVARLEQLLMPALRRGGFLRRAFGRATLPKWLASRRTQGTVGAATARLGDVVVRDFKADVAWEGAIVRITRLRAKLDEGEVRAELRADTTGTIPQYKLEFDASRVLWNDALFDVKGGLSTMGLGHAVFANLKTEGAFRAEPREPEALMGLESASGDFHAEWLARSLIVRLTDLKAAVGNEQFQGTGETTADGRLTLQLDGATRRLNLLGSTADFRAAEAKGVESPP